MRNRRRTGGRRWRRRIAGLHVALSLAAILSVGIFVERTAREMSIQLQRVAATGELERTGARLEAALDAEVATLARVAGALAVLPGIDAAGFDALVSGLLRPKTALNAIAADKGHGHVLLHDPAGAADPALQRAWTRPPSTAGLGGGDTSPGSNLLVAGGTGSIVVWIPILPEGADRPAGRVIGRLDANRVFGRTGPGAARSAPAFDYLLVAADEIDAPGVAFLGAADVRARAPVQGSVALPGALWTLAAVPSHGWQASAATLWPIRGLTVLSMALVGAFVLRARSLERDRRRKIRALEERGREFRRLSQRLDLALDASKVGVWEFDIGTGALIWDARMDELYGLQADGATRTYADWHDRLHPDDVDRARAEFLEAIRAAASYRSEFRLVLPDGRLRHIRAIGSVYRDRDLGEKILGCNWDVTDDVRRTTELEARRHDAERAAGANSTFLANMSHEIRTPMNGIVGMLDLLLRTNLPAEAHERARLARGSAEHLLVVLNDVLELSKLQATAIRLAADAVDVTQLGNDVVGLLSAAAEDKRIALTMSTDGTVPAWIAGDSTRLRQVLLNLVGNAVKFTDAGSVELKLAYASEAAGAGMLELTVRDTGIGIPDAARAALFGRFVQVESPDGGSRGGTGLGLAISRQIVDLMGGSITLDSVPGLGSTFRVRVPAPVAAVPEDAAEAMPPPLPDGPRRRGAQILLAEDNPTNRKVIHAFLEMAGHEVTMVENGAEVLEAMRGAWPELVLMDIQMPVLDGLATVRSIRALGGAAARLPIVALTANSSDGAVGRWREDGFDRYLTKPVSMDALLGTIDALLGLRDARPGADACSPAGAANSGAAPISRSAS